METDPHLAMEYLPDIVTVQIIKRYAARHAHWPMMLQIQVGRIYCHSYDASHRRNEHA